MRVRLSEARQGVIGIAGHVGSGHCHSHNQFLQDDSAGLATVLALFQEATGLPLVVKEVLTEIGMRGSITVKTTAGGSACCFPRRGVTMHEARLAKSLEGRDAVRTQTLVLEAFGRFYGQGVHETPVALQTALANAALDSFVKNFPSHFKDATENLENCCGRISGAVLDFDGVAVSVLGTVNASPDGTGPVEDLEGNVFAGSKKTVMSALGMESAPTVVVEGKVYSPAYSADAAVPYFLVRADPVDDNPVVGESITRAVENLGYAVRCRTDVMKRTPNALENISRALGEAVIAAGEELKNARHSQDKVAALAKLARLVSEDGAGISFMSDRLHEVVSGTGIMPGTGAVLSCVVPQAYRDHYVLPFLTEEDLMRYVAVVKGAVACLHRELPAAKAHLERHAWQGDLDALVRIAR